MLIVDGPLQQAIKLVATDHLQERGRITHGRVRWRHCAVFIGFVFMSNFIVTDDQIAEYKQTVEELRQQAEQTQVTCLSSTKI